MTSDQNVAETTEYHGHHLEIKIQDDNGLLLEWFNWQDDSAVGTPRSLNCFIIVFV